MSNILTLVVYMTLLTWLTIVVASILRTQAWTLKGITFACGNREDLPAETPLAGRATRAASNTVDNFVLFVAIALVAHLTVPSSDLVLRGAEIFFWSRLVYVPAYYIGIKYMRTVIWAVGVGGLAMMVVALV